MSFPGRALQRAWHLVDAKDQTVGRLATVVAPILRGKHKPTYAPHQDVGDYVVIVNADKVQFTGNKWQGTCSHRAYNWIIQCTCVCVLSCVVSRSLYFPSIYLSWRADRQALQVAHWLPRRTEAAEGGGHAGAEAGGDPEEGHPGDDATDQPEAQVHRAQAQNLCRRGPPTQGAASRRRSGSAAPSSIEVRGSSLWIGRQVRIGGQLSKRGRTKRLKSKGLERQ